MDGNDNINTNKGLQINNGKFPSSNHKRLTMHNINNNNLETKRKHDFLQQEVTKILKIWTKSIKYATVGLLHAFEKVFIELFSSKEYAIVYGRAANNHLNLLKNIHNITETNFKILNLHTRSEGDKVSGEIYEMEKTLAI